MLQEQLYSEHSRVFFSIILSQQAKRYHQISVCFFHKESYTKHSLCWIILQNSLFFYIFCLICSISCKFLMFYSQISKMSTVNNWQHISFGQIYHNIALKEIVIMIFSCENHFLSRPSYWVH